MKMTNVHTKYTPGPLLTMILAALMLAGCGGESTESLPDTSDNTTSLSYSGPAPANNDVLNFKREVWDNLATANKCGACHNAGGQSPQFAHENDINIAYSQAGTIVNLSDPSQSAMVTKVAGGHNCWSPNTNAACSDILTRYISNWAGGSEGSVKTVELRAPDNIRDPGDTLSFPQDSGDFAANIYPTLTTYCSDCHTSDGQTPYIASTDVDLAYEQAKSRIDLNDLRDEEGNLVLPADASSRLVQRLLNDNHNCWDNSCEDSAMTMLAKIQDFIVALGEPEPVPAELVTSKAVVLGMDGLEANSGGRFEDNVIALYEFKTGEGQQALDTSGVSPAINMTLSGNVSWVGGWGIQFGPSYMTEEGATVRSGKAQGSTADSSKLHTLLTASGEYSVEAWVVPGNIAQMDARIITYSGSADARNFTLGQTEQSYDVLHRTTTSDENMAFSTEENPMLVQATLQHVVVNYTPSDGRQIFVNGEPTGDVDPDAPGLFTDWDDTFALVFGNETDFNSPWEGALRMVAIHNRALTEEQIQANYDVGVGQKFYLLFGVSDVVDIPDSFIVFEASQFDSFGYLFTNPFFISLDESASPSNIPLEGMRIGINGREPSVGQAFANLDVTLGDNYTAGSGQPLSSQGTVIGLENGPETDEFFLTFERLHDQEDVRVEADPTPAPTPADLEPASDIGLKTFDEINASMSRMTGVPTTNNAVNTTFTTVKQQLPTIEDMEGFLSSHQMAVTQMAIQYCDALVDDNGQRASFFPGFDFDESANTAFDAAGRDQIKDPLLQNFVGTGLNSQPVDADIETELDNLMTRLTTCAGTSSCPAGRTETVVKASCAAVLGSATTLIQ